MIRPLPNEPDWFVVPPELVTRLDGSPGIRWKRSRFEIHRSQLPLIKDDLEVSRLLDRSANLQERKRLDELTAPLGFTLRTHQHVGLEFINGRRGSLIADQMRVGKTLSALMSHDPTQGSLVVISPKIVREVWLTWIQRRYPGVELTKDIAIMQGREFDRSDFSKPFIIGHYDILKYWQSVGGLAKIGTLIFDEAHVLSKLNHRTIAANFISSRSAKVLALTGTPLWNKPSGLWFILNILGQEGWGSHWDFRMRFCDPEPSAYGMKFNGTSRELELKERLSEVMICRKLKDVSDSVPEISRDVLIADITPEQRLDIDVQAEELKAATTVYNAIGALARYRQVIGKLKIDATVEAAKNVVEREEPVVIWTWHKDVASAVQSQLKGKFKAFVIDGDTSDKRREKLLTEWRACPNGALIISLIIGQAGIDLSHARIAIFCEIDFTPAVVAQAEMRIYSAIRPMHISYIVIDHPVDRQIVAAMKGKLDNSDKLKVPAAEAAIDVLAAAFTGGKMPDGDLERLMKNMLEAGF